MYNDELLFEHDLVESLKQNGWIDGVLNRPTEKDLIDNWAKILYENNKQQDRLGDYFLTDSEMQQILENINKLKTPLNINNFINGKTISIVRDNRDDKLHFGKEISLKIYDRQEIVAGQSRYQIAEQPIFNTSSSFFNNRRGDIMLLINGMPLFHIELKKSNVPIRQATNQIEKYFHERVYSGLFRLVQVFVAMTPEETIYFANPGFDGKFNQSFYFHWENFNNEVINNWKDITHTLLSIPMAHQLIGFYTVADDTDGVLKVMRSYQYYAANKISDVVSKTDWTNPNTRGGFVWHTTGSGKTMTSFKSAQLIANSKDADKVIFLMDRIELGTQSLNEYQGFADSKYDVVGTDDTKDLITKLKDDKNVLIVTSIQKMSNIKDAAGMNTYDINLINRKRMVIIVDECHRDTFGKMMSNIKEMFSRAVFFGFTGTPVFDENKKKLSVTSDIFGNELHRYVIADGIKDGAVLGFDLYKVSTFNDIDLRRAIALEKSRSNSEIEAILDSEKSKIYYKYMNEIEMASREDKNGNFIKGIEDFIPISQYNEKHREQVVNNILSNWVRISRNNKFSAILATSSISDAILYYRLLKFKEADKMFKFTVLVDQNIDNNDGAIFKEDALVEIINDYNKIYGQKFSLSSRYLFKKDVCNRLAHKKAYSRINDNDKIGLLIVVDQMLTGFDSKWLNALYLDKVLKYENIIQAFSRTNRVFDKQEKPFGIIKYYRKPYTMGKNIEKAIKLYSGDKPFQLFVPKLDENIEKMNLIFKDIKKLFVDDGINNFERLPESPEMRRKFVKLYNEFNKYLTAAVIQGYNIKGEVDQNSVESTKLCNLNNGFKEVKIKSGDMCSSFITIEDLAALNQRYIDIERDQRKHPREIPFDIDGSLIEVDNGKIDFDYLDNRFKKYLKVLKQANCTKEELDNTLNNFHRTFASLPLEKQKYANMLLHDIQSGDIVIDVSKTFMDYIIEYKKINEDNLIKKLVAVFGLDEKKLRSIMSSDVNESNINAFGRFDELIDSVNMELAKETLEKIYGRDLKIYEVNIEIDEILRKFILDGVYNLN